jgi:hypothetical protein
MWVPRDDPSVIMLWSKLFGREVARKGPLTNRRMGIAGTSAENGVRVSDDLSKERGGSVRHEMFYRLTGRGRVGPNERLKDHLEGLRRSHWDTKVDLFRHGVASEMRMTAQLVSWDLVPRVTDALATYVDEKFETWAALHGAGYSVVTDLAHTGNNAIRALHPNYIIRPNGRTHAGELVAGDEITPDFVNQVQLHLKLLEPQVAPMRLPDGTYGYLWNISSADAARMMDTQSGFYNALLQALAGSKFAGNPLFSGKVIGRWRNFYFVENPYLPPGLSDTPAMVQGTTRGFILGAQGLAFGFGRGDRPAGYGLENRYLLETDREDWIIGQWAASTIVGVDRPGFIHPDEKNTPGAVERELGVVGVETFSPLPASWTDYDQAYNRWLAMGVAKSW